MLYYISIALTILANVVYHLCQKSISPKISPLFSLAVTYFTAFVISILLLLIYPKTAGEIVSFRVVNWATFVLGIAIIGLEAGFLLAYRAGWNVSAAAIFSNVAVTLLLIPIGIFCFKDHLSPTNWFGIIFSVIGLIMMSHK